MSVCEGTGKRVAAPCSSAFPEEKCPNCHYYAAPVKKHGEWYIRSHRAVKTDPYAEEVTPRRVLTSWGWRDE